MGLVKRFSLKEGVSNEELFYMSPMLYSLFAYLLGYCETHELPCTVTSITGEAEGRVTATHKEGRAIDVSVRGWSEFHIHRFVKKANNKFANIGAISSSDYKPRAVVYHAVDGGAPHFHLQVKRQLYGDY